VIRAHATGAAEPGGCRGHELGVGEPTDRELWAAAAAGDADAFGRLFDRHARAVYNFAFRRTASWALAEDLTSEVFLLAWRRRGDVVFTNADGRVLPWLLGVATNVIRNRRRSDRRAAAALVRLGAAPAERDFSDDVLGRLADEHEMARILAVVHELSEPEQEVLALCAWSELSYEDCALALGVPVGTVRSRLSRARAHLRELVDARGHERRRATVTETCL
jgi:RNA polymerase sigma-70 factor (ECF subfamily)